MLSRRTPLVDPAVQLATLDAIELPGGDFDAKLACAGLPPLVARKVRVFQINVGKLCNMTCRHCHVDAGPDRWAETMDRPTMEACLRALDRTEADTVDITGGAPELNPHFRWLVDECVARGKHVIDRCNLTVLLLGRTRGLPEWLAERGVEVVASLPHNRRSNTDAQRGSGTYDRSIAAMKLLNAAGYGAGDPKRVLTLMHNPSGAWLPSAQAAMEREWKASLERDHGVRFDRLIALNNMPISRFLEWLESTGNTEAYLKRLLDAFNPGAVSGLMCTDTLSVGWDGRIYDCDFNQMLAMEADMDRPHVDAYDPAQHDGRAVRTARHCFGCTAGAGSSCGGATT
ncbi:MAG: arsenosugar biosynthesis radical SAM protein ArsS [Alphaproteobacteria bacterium]|nr:arsenosugar biosynthesis radical SAM protein ArsS [Alphaproteobacteria bacterium]MCB9698042.1 arsenosugar biosynthesis radical SAM protein ArsS [Alphaproteobacteria bacterium]